MDFHLNLNTTFSQLPLGNFDNSESRIYILDANGLVLFVNKAVLSQLNLPFDLFIGKSILKIFPSLALDPDFQILKKNIKKKKSANLIIVSPVTGERVSIIGHALKNCYFFSTSVLTTKQELINDLRKTLEHR